MSTPLLQAFARGTPLTWRRGWRSTTRAPPPAGRVPAPGSLQLNLALLNAGHAAEAAAVLLHVVTPRRGQVWMYAVLG